MANDKVVKQISLDKANFEFIQSIYGDISPSVIINMLVESLRDELRERNISFDTLRKRAAILADEKLREL